jgi:hypothetical protein
MPLLRSDWRKAARARTCTVMPRRVERSNRKWPSGLIVQTEARDRSSERQNGILDSRRLVEALFELRDVDEHLVNVRNWS